MAFIYCDSAATGLADGTTFDDAYTDLEQAIESAAAGDTVFVDDGHSNTVSALVKITSSGTPASPVIVVSVDKTTASDTSTNVGSSDADYSTGSTIATKPTLETSAGNNMFFEGVAIVYGVTFKCGGSNFLVLTDGDWRLQECGIHMTRLADTDLGANANDATIRIVDCRFLFANSGQAFIVGNGAKTFIDGGLIESGGTAINALFDNAVTGGGVFQAENFDASNMANGGDLVGALPTSIPDGAGIEFRFSNVKLPASGSVNSATFADPSSRIEAYNVAVDDTIHRFHVEDYFGTVSEDTANYRDATYDGTSGYSAKMVSSAQALELFRPLRFKLWEQYVASANPTLTVQTLTDGVTLQDDEFWIEVVYPDATTGALGKRATTRPNPQATPANLATSSEVWTEFLTTDTEQQVAHTVTGGQAGVHQVWVHLAKPSTTVYVDPAVDVT